MNKERLKNKSYLGDGVYVGIDEYGQTILHTEREEGTHWIALDSGMITTLYHRTVKVVPFQCRSRADKDEDDQIKSMRLCARRAIQSAREAGFAMAWPPILDNGSCGSVDVWGSSPEELLRRLELEAQD